VQLHIGASALRPGNHWIPDKVARRVQDPEILHLLRLMLKASGKRGSPKAGWGRSDAF